MGCILWGFWRNNCVIMAPHSMCFGVGYNINIYSILCDINIFSILYDNDIYSIFQEICSWYVLWCVLWYAALTYNPRWDTDIYKRNTTYSQYMISYTATVYTKNMDMVCAALLYFVLVRYQGIILCLAPANERRCYIVTSSLIDWVHTQNDP